MKRNILRSRLLALLVCVFAWVGANAQTYPYVESITENGQTIVVVHTNAVGQMGNLQNNPAIQGASYLRLIGPFSSDDFTKIPFRGQTLDLSAAEIDQYTALGNLKTNLVTLYMPAVSSYTTVANNFCADAVNLVNLVLPANITTIGELAFSGTPKLTSVTLPHNLQYIKAQAFKGSALTSITIPGSVRDIATGAFFNCDDLNTVFFDEKRDAEGNIIYKPNGDSAVEMTIQEQAFRNSDAIWDVYVNTLGKLTCVNKAFDFETTYAHGDPNRETAVLHYPKEKVAEYCNLNHVLDFATASNPAAFHNWLMEHFNRANNQTINGWHEFVESGTSEDEIPVPSDGKILKTFSFYSDVKDADGNHKPVAMLVPEGVKAYIINKIVKNDDGYYVLTLKSIHAIPEETGVLLYGVPNSKNKDGIDCLSMTTVPYVGKPIRREFWDTFKKPKTKDNGDIVTENGQVVYTNDPDLTARNLLMPTSVDANGVETSVENDNLISLAPYELDGTNHVEYRNFVLGRRNQTSLSKVTNDYYGYFRVRPGTISPGKSWLRLHRDEYEEAEGAEAIILKDDNYKQETKADGNVISEGPKWAGRTWTNPPVYDWGVPPSTSNNVPLAKFYGEPIFEEVNEGIATLIIPVESVSNRGIIYTLQGTPINNPTKPGIYIQNGKKTIIK